jgi:hypothetical protein
MRMTFRLLLMSHASEGQPHFKIDPDRAATVFRRSGLRNNLEGALHRKMPTFHEPRRVLVEAESLPAGGEHDVGSTHVLELFRDSGPEVGSTSPGRPMIELSAPPAAHMTGHFIDHGGAPTICQAGTMAKVFG